MTRPPFPAVLEEPRLMIEEQSILVDEDTYLWARNNKWCINGSGYVCNTNGFLHRQLFGLLEGDKRVVDHINGDKLDNRRVNLRVMSQSENNFNARLRTDNTSGCKGVVWDKVLQKWKVQITFKGVCIFVGAYATKELAIEMNKAAREEVLRAIRTIESCTATIIRSIFRGN